MTLAKVGSQAANPVNQRAYSILTFAGVFAILLFLIYEIQNNANGGENLLNSARKFAHIYLPALNGNIFGRRLAPDVGEYFLNIPYAHISPERFKSPLLAYISPNYTFYAIHYVPGCPNGYARVNSVGNRVGVLELCENMNIYRCAQNNQASNTMDALPVLVYLTDGLWESRNDANLHPHSVIQRLACGGKMIVVSVNYRMGIYGFFNNHEKKQRDVNFALKDIVAALNFVQNEVAHFGGNPKAITVMARGIGAQMMTKIEHENKGLFQRLILMSGSGFAPSVYQKDKDIEDTSQRFAMLANCTGSNFTELVKCVQQLPEETIQQVEKNFPFKTFLRWPIIGKVPRTTVSVPTIMGVCRKQEKVPLFATQLSARNNKISENDSMLATLRSRLEEFTDLNALNYSTSVIEHYLNEFKNRDDTSIDEILEKIKWDFVMDGPLLLEAHHRSKTAPVYYFEYEDMAKRTRPQVDVGALPIEYANTVDHRALQVCLDDLLFNPLNKMEFLMERKIENIFLRYLINFVHSGSPNDYDSTHNDDDLIWPQYIENSTTDFSFSNSTWYNAETKNKVLKLSVTQGAYVANHDASATSKNFWLCKIPEQMQIDNVSEEFCDI